MNDTQIPCPLPSKRADFFCFQKVAQCSETNLKLSYRFLIFIVFNIWLFKILRIFWEEIRSIRYAIFWNIKFDNFAIFFKIWTILYSTFVVHSFMLYSFQNITLRNFLDQKNRLFLRGRGVWMSLTRREPQFLLKIQIWS